MAKFEKGNRASVGNKGGGRKSAFEEFLAAQWHAKAWEGKDENGKPLDVKALVKKIAGGKFGVRDRYLLKALTGDPRILAKFGDKLLPDLTMHMGPTGGAVEVSFKGEAKKRSAKYHAAK